MTVETIRLGPIDTNCYLVTTDTAAIVVDPSVYDDRLKVFLESNSDRGRYILLTHFHYDHILGAEKLRALTGVKIVIHKTDAVGLSDPILSLAAKHMTAQTPFSADLEVSDGDTLPTGGSPIRVLHTPGHTAGSVCYILENAVFSGDTLFKGSIGRTDFATSDFAGMMHSLGRLRALAGEGDFAVYPGHGAATTLSREIMFNPFMQG